MSARAYYVEIILICLLFPGEIFCSIAEEQEIECSICLESMDSHQEDLVFEFLCHPSNSHIFHRKCIVDILRNMKLTQQVMKHFPCPLCRTDYSIYHLPLRFNEKVFIFQEEFRKIKLLLRAWGIFEVCLEGVESFLDTTAQKTIYHLLLRGKSLILIASKIHAILESQKEKSPVAIEERSPDRLQRNRSYCCVM